MEYRGQDILCNNTFEAVQNGKRSWFALQVKPQSEHVVAMHLRHKGYDGFLPLYKSRRKWSDRIKEIEMPLFPGYVFCRTTSDVVGRAVTTPGVIRIVGNGRSPIPVEDEEISSVQKIIESSLSSMPAPYVAIGQKVCIRRGPLAGAEGTVMKTNDSYRLVVSIGLLLRSVAVEIDRNWLN
jgi:transcription antitermination factor NusG